jgi:hypothetical protein
MAVVDRGERLVQDVRHRVPVARPDRPEGDGGTACASVIGWSMMSMGLLGAVAVGVLNVVADAAADHPSYGGSSGA